ncbi:VOC family protein [Occultella glacieicola]|uniref:VOC family protein n=1 Tax=Occultella glacieicola TaxID=2518684 RepID=A0ABY2E6X0_9MICO|nr:VOC family protein [Occultella glacieicola]TDE97295.1 VOC family protein [Occultella glacieicola]
MTRLVPYLTVHDGAAAVAFYAAAFGARETGERYDEEDGRIGHTTLAIGDDVFYLSDEFHEYGAYAPATVGHSTAAIVLGVADVDAAYAAAVAAGATPDREPSGEGGEKRGWLVDPFGHRWALNSRQD